MSQAGKHNIYNHPLEAHNNINVKFTLWKLKLAFHLSSWNATWGWRRQHKGQQHRWRHRQRWLPELEAPAPAEAPRALPIPPSGDPASDAHPRQVLCHPAQWDRVPALLPQQRCELDSNALVAVEMTLSSFVQDTFFYCLVFDPAQKTLLADKGEIRVGSRYQADSSSMPLLKEGERENDERNADDLETLVWTPGHNLTDRQIDQFLVISR